MSPIFVFSQTLLVAVAALAFWRGRFWERTTAAVLLLNWLGTALAPPFNFIDPPWVIIGLDAAVCLFLLYAALYSDRRWTLWAAAFQVLLMANHFGFARHDSMEQWAFVTAYYIWGDLLLVALAMGTLTLRKSAPPTIPDA